MSVYDHPRNADGEAVRYLAAAKDAGSEDFVGLAIGYALLYVGDELRMARGTETSLDMLLRILRQDD